MIVNNEDKRIYQSLNSYAIPLIVQFFSNYMINLADQAILGRISVEAYGVIGIINSFHNMIVGIVGCTTVAFNIRSSRKNENALKDCIFWQEFVSSIFLSATIGFLFLIFDNIFKIRILRSLYGFTGIGLEIGVRYFAVSSSYVLIQMLIFTYGQFFKILNKTKYLLIGSTISAILNVVLDYVLVFGKHVFPKLGATGAALATIVSMAANLLILIFVSRRIIAYNDLRRNTDTNKKLLPICKQQLIDSLPLMGQELLEGGVFTVAIQSILSRMGNVELSSYLIMQQLIQFLYVPMNMYGSAVLTLTGRKVSEGDGLYRRIPFLGGFIASVLYIIPGILFIILHTFLPTIITNDLSVINMSSRFIPFAIILSSMKPLATVYKNATISIGHSKFVLYNSATVNATIVALLLLYVNFLHSSLTGFFICEILNDTILFFIFYKKVMQAKNEK